VLLPASVEHLSPQENRNSLGTQGKRRFSYETATMYMMPSMQIILPKIIDKQVNAQTASINYIRSNGTISHHTMLKVFIFGGKQADGQWMLLHISLPICLFALEGLL